MESLGVAPVGRRQAASRIGEIEQAASGIGDAGSRRITGDGGGRRVSHGALVQRQAPQRSGGCGPGLLGETQMPRPHDRQGRAPGTPASGLAARSRPATISA